MVVAVDHRTLGIGGTCVGLRALTTMVDDPYIGMLTGQPLRARAVRSQHDVEPDGQSVFFCQVEHAVKVI